MAIKCRICSHKRLAKINTDLVADRPLREIAAKYDGVTKSALHRHKQCLSDFVRLPPKEKLREMIQKTPTGPDYVSKVLDLRASLQKAYVTSEEIVAKAVEIVKAMPDAIMNDAETSIPILNMVNQMLNRNLKSIHDSMGLKILDERFGREAEVLIRESITPEVLEQLPEGDYKG